MARWAEINGVVLHYDDRGRGRPLVLIHEMGGSIESWDGVLEPLVAIARVIRLDLRGCGLSEWGGPAASIEQLAADVAGLLDHLRVVEPAVVIGCAVGAAVAMQFAAQFSTRTLGLVAMAPATGLPPERRPGALARADEVQREGFRPTIEERLAKSYPLPLRVPPERFEEVRRRRLAARPDGVASLTRMLAALDMDAALRRIACSTLVLAGSHDGDRPPELVRQVAAQIEGARFKIRETGHFMALQTPELVAEELRAFLRDLPMAANDGTKDVGTPR